MKIHEYQAKEILAKYGVAVPKGKLVSSAAEAVAAAKELMQGKPVCVVKAQIHAGGRGKGGGVKVARTREDAELHAKNILGMQLITHQTGPHGKQVQRLYIPAGVDIETEFYVALLVDRESGRTKLRQFSRGCHPAPPFR